MRIHHHWYIDHAIATGRIISYAISRLWTVPHSGLLKPSTFWCPLLNYRRQPTSECRKGLRTVCRRWHRLESYTGVILKSWQNCKWSFCPRRLLLQRRYHTLAKTRYLQYRHRFGNRVYQISQNSTKAVFRWKLPAFLWSCDYMWFDKHASFCAVTV